MNASAQLGPIHSVLVEEERDRRRSHWKGGDLGDRAKGEVARKASEIASKS